MGDEFSLTLSASFAVTTIAFSDLVEGVHFDAGGSSGDEIFGSTTLQVGKFLLGDVNCDGEVNLLDVGPFVDLISQGGFSPKADIDGDGVVNLLDVGPFIDLLSSDD